MVQWPHFGSEQVAKAAVDLLEYILADFEEICEYFKRLLDLNEGEREGLDKVRISTMIISN